MRRWLVPCVLIGATGLASAAAQPSSQPSQSMSPLSLTSPSALAEMERRLGEIDRLTADAKRELGEIGPKRVAVGERARARGRTLYKMVRAGLLPLSGGFSSFVDHAQSVERLKHAVRVDLEEEGRLVARAASLVASLDALARERAPLDERKTLAEAARTSMDEDRRRQDAFERAFGISGGSGDSYGRRRTGEGEIVVYGPNGKSPLESLDPGSFRGRKGRLTFPIAGQAEVKATAREGGPAVEIKAPLGAVVRAVHPGRVAFADRYGTYGSLVILDHGDRYYTVSANLGSLDVKVGDEISAGERIGTVGDDGRGASLYFEIRQGNEKVPPTQWLGL